MVGPGIDFVTVKRDTQALNSGVVGHLFGHVDIRADKDIAHDVGHGRLMQIRLVHYHTYPHKKLS